jgi:hypothetical protein
LRSPMLNNEDILDVSLARSLYFLVLKGDQLHVSV